MNTLELCWCATFLRGAFSVLLLLGAERLLRGRLGPEWRRGLWLLCLVLLVIPQMNLSILPVKLDLSGAAFPVVLRSGGAAAGTRPGGVETELRKNSTSRAVWRFLVFHRRKFEAAALAGLPLPALLLLLMRYLRCRRRVRRLPPVTDRRVLESWTRLLAGAGVLRRPVILLDSSVIGLGPTLFGCLRRKLLLPVDRLSELSDRELELLLEHEYQHCRSGDDRLNLFALVIWALCWYNPFLLIARRKVRSNCEVACDRALLMRHPDSVREYGGLLLKFASPTPERASVAIGLVESPRELSRRIRSMTATAAPRNGGWFSNRKAAYLLGGLIVSPLLLIAVDVRQTAAVPRSAAVKQSAPKQQLPYLLMREAVEYDADETPVGCWRLDYSDAFPAEKSELVLELCGTSHRIALASRPRALRLLRGKSSEAPEWYPETSAIAPPLPAAPELLREEGRLVRADRRMVYATVPGFSSPAAFRLEVAGVDLAPPGDSSRP